GGPPGAVCVQLVDEPATDLDVPGRDFSFARLLRAQADGDRAALVARGATVARVDLAALVAAAERLTGPGDPSRE
ncbi:MAG TPA: glucose-6-phosphate isomerase, partial [Acidimicrobiia bacterium]|nr:glucose-6-phosphate isomerase [Acidimicrobiia bacterium]